MKNYVKLLLKKYKICNYIYNCIQLYNVNKLYYKK